MLKHLIYPCLIAAVVVSTPLVAQADMLWYNGDYDNRDALENGGQGVIFNNPALEIARVYDNFVVPVGQTWTVTSVYSVNEIFYQSGLGISTATWEIRSADSNGNIGAIKYNGDTAATATAVSTNSNNYYNYSPSKVTAAVASVTLTAGTYWLTVVPDDTSGRVGDRSYIETTSGANSIGLPKGNDGHSYITNNLPTGTTGAYNLTSTNVVEGAGNWDYVMGVNGTIVPTATVPEPSSLLLMAIGSLGISAFAKYRSLR